MAKKTCPFSTYDCNKEECELSNRVRSGGGYDECVFNTIAKLLDERINSIEEKIEELDVMHDEHRSVGAHRRV